MLLPIRSELLSNQDALEQTGKDATMALQQRRAMRWCALMIIVLGCVGCDQVTKSVAQNHLKGQAPRAFCGGALRLEYAENPGAFLSLGQDWPPVARLVLLTVMNGLLMATIAGVLVVRWNMSGKTFLACALLLSGGVGNLIDRVRLDGLVVDFLNLGIGPLRTGIFNVADVAISLGAVGLILAGRPANSTATIAEHQR
jgi:signal peptidase II